jgi:hypothetical protein
MSQPQTPPSPRRQSERSGRAAELADQLKSRLGPTGMPLAAVAVLVLTFGAGWAFGSAGADDAAVVTSAPVATAPEEVEEESDPPRQAATVPSPTEPATPGDDPISTGSPDPVKPAGALPAGTVPKAPIDEFDCPEATIEVRDANDLTSALGNAEPGDVIQLADGVYQGEFRTGAKGTAKDPIFLCGGRDAVLQGEGYKGGYVLHFDNAAQWRVHGFTVRSGQKGVMLDTGVSIALQELLVTDIGDEAVHLRKNSTDNVVRGLTIRNTGNRRDKFGEGVYVGTAVSNWPQITGGQPDNSDRNFVLNNVISETTAESVDIKEGTSDGVVAGNTFDGARLSGGDSWVDVKGNGWLIAGNSGRTSPEDGFQTHVILPGWGDANRFTQNVADLNGGSGVGYYLHEPRANKINCNNKATGAGGGLSNYPCTN